MSKFQSAQPLADRLRLDTEHDLADANAVAARILNAARGELDHMAFDFSKDLFVTVLLHLAYKRDGSTFNDMVKLVADPDWDSPLQILQFFRHDKAAFLQPAAGNWIAAFTTRYARLSSDKAESLIQRSLFHWRCALGLPGATSPRRKPRDCVQVFRPALVEKAFDRVTRLDDEKKRSVGRSLDNARHNDGYRSVPNARKAGAQLEEAKGRFENLVTPISRLQMDLVLSAAMKPEEFHITPLLLLGDPGVGKTYLATQLADALGVATEKISAGGAQGGFQLTGTHAGWKSAHPGSLFTVLAEGQSASPVFVVDEVDKIVDAQYPVLPVLLDLLEPNTGKRFKDEFFEMEFDASRVIVVLTANSLDGVPTPLLSRVEVFEVPRPDFLQRLRIIQCQAELLRLKTRREIHLDEAASTRLAERTDLDLRKTTRVVDEAFAHALLSGATVAKLTVPKSDARRSIGFAM